MLYTNGKVSIKLNASTQVETNARYIGYVINILPYVSHGEDQLH